MRYRQLVPLVALTLIVVLLVSATTTARRRQTPTMSTDLQVGSLTCFVYIYADGDWYLTSEPIIKSPTNTVANRCPKEAQFPPLFITNHIDFVGPYWRPGVWSCSAYSSGSLAMYGPWSDYQNPTASLSNPTCNCITPAVNFAVVLSTPGGYHTSIADGYQAMRAELWYNNARQWWNSELSAAGSAKQFESSGSHYIVVEDLPGTQAMSWTPGGVRVIRIDPDLFDNADDDFATTLMAHELGHGVGASDHPMCGSGDAIMASPQNSVHYGLTDGDKCNVHAEYGSMAKYCS